MYKYIDDNIEEIKRKVKAYFQNARLGLMKYDELNKTQIDEEVDELYDKVQKQADLLIDGLVDDLATIYPIDKEKYPKERLFDAYNPTTLYVYKNEMERKRARYKEMILSSLYGQREFQGKRKDFNRNAVVNTLSNMVFLKAMNSNINNVNRQIEETAVDSERNIILDYGKEKGEQYVRWITMEDERVCGECDSYNGMIFPIDELPPRPHSGCRCEFEFVSENEFKEIED